MQRVREGDIMTYTALTPPLRGYTDQASYRARSSDYTKSCLNVMPFDVWERRLRIGTRQGFCVLGDMQSPVAGKRIQGMLPYKVYRDGTLIEKILVVAGGQVFDCTSTSGQGTALGSHTSAAAATTIAFGSAPSAAQTITLKDNSDPQVEKTYTAHDSQILGERKFDRSGSAADTAASLKACIENSNGHNGTITVAIDGANLTLTQASAGELGNTTITSNLSGATIGNDGKFDDGTGAPWRVPNTLSTSAERVEMVQFRTYAYIIDGTNYFRIDLSLDDDDLKLEHWWELRGTDDPGTVTASEVYDKTSGTVVRPASASLIAVWGARIVLGGFAATPNVWIASKVSDPTQWNPVTNNAGFAIAGGNSPEYAVLGDRITALIPFGSTGLLLAGADSMSYMDSDPVFGETKMAQISREVGAVGPRAVCEGPEKTAYVVANDGVYHIKPNDFDVNRGDRISAGALDGMFSRMEMADLAEVVAVYNESKGVLQVFLSRGTSAETSRHAAYDIATQSWWPFEISDTNNPNPVCAATFKSYANGRQTVWLGGVTGRISTQPANGVFPQDGLKVSAESAWTVTESPANFDCRVMLGPINTDVSQRVLLRDVRVRLQSDTEVIATGDQGGLAGSGMPTSTQLRDLTSGTSIADGQTIYKSFTTDIATLSVFDIEAIEIADVADQNVTVTDNILSTNTDETGADALSLSNIPGTSGGLINNDYGAVDDGGADDTTSTILEGGRATDPSGLYLRQTDDEALMFMGPGPYVLMRDGDDTWKHYDSEALPATLFANKLSVSLPDKIYDKDYQDGDGNNLSHPENISYLGLEGSITLDPASPIATFSLQTGINNAFRTRIRSTDLYFQVSSTGRAWAIEDISVDIEPGGPVRTVRS